MRRKNKRFYGEPMKVKFARRIRYANAKYDLSTWLDALLAGIGVCVLMMIVLLFTAMLH